MIVKFERSKSNVRFVELQKLLEELGYTLKRTKGSHYTYGKKDMPPFSIQRDEGDKSKAKKYQVNDVIKIAKKIIGESNET